MRAEWVIVLVVVSFVLGGMAGVKGSENRIGNQCYVDGKVRIGGSVFECRKVVR